MKRILYALVALMILAGVTMPAASASERNYQTGDEPGSFVVLMDLDPVIAYEGEVQGYGPTKPGKGGKINPNSAHVKKYEKFLVETQNQALNAVGASEANKPTATPMRSTASLPY